jgi:hypothetical protein
MMTAVLVCHFDGRLDLFYAMALATHWFAQHMDNFLIYGKNIACSKANQRKKPSAMLKPACLALSLLAVVCGAAAQAPGYVAGLQPDQRPAGAPPPTTQVNLTPDQLSRALRGIEGPPPGNVEAIAATGSWWVPLRAAGMTPPYDLREWHQGQDVTAGAAAPAAR